MRRIRIKISSRDFLTAFHHKFLDAILFLEILEMYQYDQSNFLSLQRIRLKPGLITALDNTMKNTFGALWYQILEQKGDEILCIMKQQADQGFWPLMINEGQWGLIPPITVDPEFILLSVVTNEDSNPNLFDAVKGMAQTIQVLAIEKIGGDNVQYSKYHSIPQSHFTPRQREVATYAVRHGYYEIPKKLDAAQIAEHFQITSAAVSEHLRKIEQKLMLFVFG